ncbi:hypothetical protein [Sphingomonas alpina]|uniref:Uncharacterized protein n=1 Tax=Sphingomonas alpina TaxID=653931 RepID=A0A7H0LHT9_9SPHN|nr:hypothetical protein [Sphingomonas alpina]QNQ09242.1 hypothetical protein H3Z74_21650 [Sphingomonas alpina]
MRHNLGRLFDRRDAHQLEIVIDRPDRRRCDLALAGRAVPGQDIIRIRHQHRANPGQRRDMRDDDIGRIEEIERDRFDSHSRTRLVAVRYVGC